ncbi:hypothetical protein BVX97_03240 [bacterium E08(2017)]|nr:hypothetical protein BVX97_03240 [bacterium E08(2017)]
MARPYSKRRVRELPQVDCFRPAGVPVHELQEVELTLDEYEAIRLADSEGRYQAHAAASMEVSRQTFGRIIRSAHRKVAETLTQGKALRVHGGSITISKEEPK